MVYTDASTTGWGATFNGLVVSGVWTGPPTALAHKLPRVAGSTPGPEPSQEALTGQARTGPYGHTVTVAYINRQGGLRFRRMSQLARHLFLWSQKHLRSFVPFTFRASSTGQPTSCHELRSPESGDSIPRRPSLLRDFSLPVVYSLTEETLGTECTGTQLATGPPQVCVPPSEPSRTDTVQDQGGQGAGLARGAVLAHSDLVPRTDAPRDSPSLADSSEVGSTTQRRGTLWHPRPDLWKLKTCLVPGRDAEVLGDLPQEVVDTITSARALSTRHAYALKWNLFVEWCSSHREDPRKCPIRVVLSFLQQGLERRLSPFTLKVYVAVIAANHDPVEGKSVGKHDLVIRFFRGAGRLNHPRPPLYPLGTCL